jgi:uncharacterized paraquat-inducible protein A
VYAVLPLAHTGDAALAGLVTASIVVPLVLLAVVCWIFWRAARRDAAEANGEKRAS